MSAKLMAAYLEAVRASDQRNLACRWSLSLQISYPAIENQQLQDREEFAGTGETERDLSDVLARKS